MPIEVELPDGSIAEFPDGTPKEAMRQAISKRFPPKAPQRGAIEETGRQAGLGARHVIEGIAGTAGIVYDPLASIGNAILPGDPFMSAASLGQSTADTLGLPAPENVYERVAGGVTRAATGGGGMIGLGRSLATAPGTVGRVGASMAASPGAQTIAAGSGGAAVEGAREAGVGPGGQLVAGLVGALAPGAAFSAAPAGVRSALGGNQAATRETIADFARAGVQPSTGQATGSFLSQALESTLGRLPGSAGVIARKAESQRAQMGQRAEDVAAGLAPKADATQAGRSIERGLDQFVADNKAKANLLYTRAGQLLPPDTRLPLTNAQQTLAELTRLVPGAESTTARLVNPKVREIAEALGEDLLAAQGKGLPYEAVQALRSRVGAELDSFSLSADKPTAELKRLYAALSKDMEAAAANTPAARQAMKRANDFYRASQNRIEVIERVVNRNGGPEKVFQAALSGTPEGATTLRAVMQSLPKEAQRDVSAAVVRRLGRATPGKQDDLGEAFSPETFLTNWNRLSKDARKVLFDRFGPKFSDDMSNLAKVANRMRESGGVLANPSGTAAATAQGVGLGSLGLSIITGNLGTAGAVGGGMVAANTTARLLTNPRFVSWLAKNSNTSTRQAGQQALILSALGRKYNEPELIEFAEALKQTNQQPQPAAE